MQTEVHPENAMLLLAAVARVTIRDAKRGNVEAKEWLCEVVPEWTKYDAPPTQKHAAHRKAGAGGVTKRKEKVLL